MKSLLFACVPLLFLFSCNDKAGVEINSLVLNIDIPSENSPAMKDIIYIPLEINDNCLIGNIDKIIYRAEQFYIFDRNSKTVFVFNDKGEFLYNIQKIGNGPGEYIDPTDMDVDELGNVYIADNPTQKIIKYISGNVNQFETIDIGKYFLDFVIADSNLIYLGDLVKDGCMNIRLAKFEKESKKLSLIHKCEFESKKVIPKFSQHYFFRSGGQIHYYKRFSPYIYSIKNGLVEKVIKLRSDQFPSDELVESWSKNADIHQMQADKIHIKDISAYYETKNSIFITLRDGALHQIVVDKDSGKIYKFSSFSSERFYGNIGAYSASVDHFVSYCTPTKEKIQGILSHNPNIDENLKVRLLSLDDESNPILILFNFEFK